MNRRLFLPILSGLVFSLFFCGLGVVDSVLALNDIGNSKEAFPKAPAPQGDDFCSDGQLRTITFDGLQAGEILSNQLPGISVNAFHNGPKNPANPDIDPDITIIFDSNNPTGGDDDLGTPNQNHGGPGQGSGGIGTNTVPLNNLVIIPTNSTDTSPPDGLVDVPNDDAAGGEILFNFDKGVGIGILRVVDIEQLEGAVVEGLDKDNNLTFSIAATGVGDNSVEVLEVNDSARDTKTMRFILNGSGALGEFTYCEPNPEPPVCDLTIAGPVSVEFGDKFEATFEVSDPDNDSVSLSYVVNNGLPNATVFTPPAGMPSVPFTGTISAKPDADDVGKTFSFDIVIEDKDEPSLTSTCSVAFAVTPPPPPECVVVGPLNADCDSIKTVLELDASGSVCSVPIRQKGPGGTSITYLPQDCPFTYEWSTDCPGAQFENATTANPSIEFDTVSNLLPVSCTATVTITDQFGSSSSCQTQIMTEGCEFDCLGELIVDGKTPAVFDECGDCNGNNQAKDDCGVCDGENRDMDDCGDCFGGNSAKDDCGVCDGDNSLKDSCGVCNGGDLALDECGLCFGDGSGCCEVTPLGNTTLRIDGLSARQNAHTQLLISAAGRTAKRFGKRFKPSFLSQQRQISEDLHMDTWHIVNLNIPQQDVQCGLSVNCINLSTDEVSSQALFNSRSFVVVGRAIKRRLKDKLRNAGLSREEIRLATKTVRRAHKRVRRDNVATQNTVSKLPEFISSCTDSEGDLVF